MALMSMRAYAKHRGIDVAAVSRAVKNGKISTVTSEDGKTRFINSEVADREWITNSDPARVKHIPTVTTEGKGAPSVNESAKVLKIYQAKLARLEYEEKAEKLHDVEACKRERFKSARSVRDAMLGIPDRLSAELAGETDQFAIRKRLDDEIRQALENIADEIESGA